MEFPILVSHVNVKMVMEEEDKAGEIITVYAVKVSRYLGLTPRKGLTVYRNFLVERKSSS